MPEIMMLLGDISFSIDTAAYQRLLRTKEYRWSRQARIGGSDALQYTGVGAESIELDGVIYPEFRGGRFQLDFMRNRADQAAPRILISGTGRVMGRWVIESITEGQTIYAAGGVPRRQEFTLRLGAYSGGAGSDIRFA